MIAIKTFHLLSLEWETFIVQHHPVPRTKSTQRLALSLFHNIITHTTITGISAVMNATVASADATAFKALPAAVVVLVAFVAAPGVAVPVMGVATFAVVVPLAGDCIPPTDADVGVGVVDVDALCVPAIRCFTILFTVAGCGLDNVFLETEATQ
jgi:hypothetical protein